MTKKPAKAKARESAAARRKGASKAAPARRAVIPAGCASIEAVYDILARDLGFPAHFGRNLDALYDTLTGDVPGPLEIAVIDAKALVKALGAKGKALLKVLADASAARRDLTLET